MKSLLLVAALISTTALADVGCQVAGGLASGTGGRQIASQVINNSGGYSSGSTADCYRYNVAPYVIDRGVNSFAGDGSDDETSIISTRTKTVIGNAVQQGASSGDFKEAAGRAGVELVLDAIFGQ